MRGSYRSEGPRVMIFDGTMGLDTNRLSLAKVLCQWWGGVLAGASLVLALSFFVVGALRAAKPQAAAEFDRDVKPILQSSCIACHGLDRHEGQLRLDSEVAVLRGGASGKVELALVSVKPMARNTGRLKNGLNVSIKFS